MSETMGTYERYTLESVWAWLVGPGEFRDSDRAKAWGCLRACAREGDETALGLLHEAERSVGADRLAERVAAERAAATQVAP